MIKEETPAFLNALRLLSEKSKPAADDDTVEVSADAMIYLRDKLLDIKSACEAFDIVTAKDALGDLQRKKWPRHINGILDEISVDLLHSAFNKAAVTAEKAANTQ